MSKNIFKYVGPEYLDRVIKLKDAITLKCSYPKDFNDPYEQFLTIDFKEEPGVLAFYVEVIGNIKQHPVTCFSSSPIALPMWAHYAKNLTGVAIEIDEAALVSDFPESQFDDVVYRESPDPDLRDMLYRAHVIGKPRYLHFLQGGVFNAAYFTKAICWDYEKERRMVLASEEVRVEDGMMLVDIPAESISSFICGPRASVETKAMALKKSLEFGCNYFELQIGKTSAIPYFINSSGDPFIFNANCIKPASNFCFSCKEPLEGNEKTCSWCQIDDDHKTEAASRNIFRVLQKLNMLEDYFDGMEDIGRGWKDGAL